MTNEAKKRPGLAFIGLAVGTGVSASIAYFLLKDLSHFKHVVNDLHLGPYLQTRLKAEEVVESLLTGVAEGTTISSGYISIHKLYRLAERHFEKRLAQPNA